MMRSRNLLFGLGAVLASASDFPTQEQAEAFFELATVNGTSCSFVLASEADATLGLFADPAADAPQPTGLGQIADGPQEAFEWLFVPAENGTVNIVNKASSNCLEATGSDAAVFADVCDSSAEQEWNAVLNENGDPPEYDFTSPAFGNDFLANGELQTASFGWDRDNGTCVDLPSKGKFPYIPKLYGATHYKSWDHIPFPNDYLGCDFAQQPGFFPSAYYDKSGSYKSDWTDYYGSHQIKAADPHPKLLLGVEAIPSALVNDPAFPDVANKTMQFMENPYYFLKKSVSWKKIFSEWSTSFAGKSVKKESGFSVTDFNAIADILPYAVALNEPENVTEHKDWHYLPEKTTPLEMLAKSFFFQIEQNDKEDKPHGQPYDVHYFFKLNKLGYEVAGFIPVFHYELFDSNWLQVLDVDFVGKPKDPQFVKLVVECGDVKFLSPAPPAVAIAVFQGGDDTATSITGDDTSSANSTAISNVNVTENDNDVIIGNITIETGDQNQTNIIGDFNVNSQSGNTGANSTTGDIFINVTVINGDNNVTVGDSFAYGNVTVDIDNGQSTENNLNASSDGTNQNWVNSTSDNSFASNITVTSGADSDVNVTDINNNEVNGNISSTISDDDTTLGENQNTPTIIDDSERNNIAKNNNSAVQTNEGSIEGNFTAITTSGSGINATLENDASNKNYVNKTIIGENQNEVDADSDTDINPSLIIESPSQSDVYVNDSDRIQMNPNFNTSSSADNLLIGINVNQNNVTDNSDRSQNVTVVTTSENTNVAPVNSSNVVNTDVNINGTNVGTREQSQFTPTVDTNGNAGANGQQQQQTLNSNSTSGSGSTSSSADNTLISMSNSTTGDINSGAQGGDVSGGIVNVAEGVNQTFIVSNDVTIGSNNNFGKKHDDKKHIGGGKVNATHVEDCSAFSHDLVDDYFVTHEDEPLTENVLTNDPDDWEVIPGATPVTTSEGGTVVFISPDGTFEYTPPENFVGIDTFFYTAQIEVTDGVFCKATARVAIKVVGKDDPPVAKDIYLTLNVDCKAKEVPSIKGRAEAHDPDTQSSHLTYPLLTNPSKGKLEWNVQTGYFTYTPPKGETESFEVSWEYAAKDKTTESDPATVTVRVEIVGECFKDKEEKSGGLFDLFGGGDFLKLDGFKFPGLDGFKLGDMGGMEMPGLSGAGVASEDALGLDKLGEFGDLPIGKDFGDLPVGGDIPMAGMEGIDKLPNVEGIDFELLKGFGPKP
mmetsp:Transcript_41052/g.80990  ORF Transcript_41052/g.80990 Transcript_41052/m.80990 type:complete len:1227 (+) Transcript_41052:122-3802(+)